MPISEPQKEALRISTQSAAEAFLHDVEYFRDMLEQRGMAPAVLRRATPALRRLIVEEDLVRVAAPRTGKIRLVSSDYRPLHRANEEWPFHLVANDGFSIFVNRRANPALIMPSSFHKGAAFDAQKEVLLDVNAFSKQRIMCFEGEWVTRADIIKYIAHHGGAVHNSTRPMERSDLIVRRVIATMKRTTESGVNKTRFQHDLRPLEEHSFKYDPTSYDAATVEIGQAIVFVMKSPDVLALEAAIRCEFGA